MCPPAPSVLSFPKVMRWWISLLLSHHLGRAVAEASAYKSYGRARTGIQDVLTSKCVFLLLISACSLSCEKRLAAHIYHSLALLGALFFLSATTSAFIGEREALPWFMLTFSKPKCQENIISFFPPHIFIKSTSVKVEAQKLVFCSSAVIVSGHCSLWKSLCQDG